MLRKILSVICALIFVLSLCACGNNENNSNNTYCGTWKQVCNIEKNRFSFIIDQDSITVNTVVYDREEEISLQVSNYEVINCLGYNCIRLCFPQYGYDNLLVFINEDMMMLLKWDATLNYPADIDKRLLDKAHTESEYIYVNVDNGVTEWPFNTPQNILFGELSVEDYLYFPNSGTFVYVYNVDSSAFFHVIDENTGSGGDEVWLTPALENDYEQSDRGIVKHGNYCFVGGASSGTINE